MKDDQPEIIIRAAREPDLDALEALALAMGKPANDMGYFIRQLEYQREGERALFIAERAPPKAQAVTLGYCILNWKPKYPAFRRLGIPEIQDLNVHPDARQHGHATRMIRHCEALAQAKGCEQMGIGVGLCVSYGAAQRLYTKLGYVPDGQGINYDRAPVAYGEFRPVDDDLCLMMLKSLQNR